MSANKKYALPVKKNGGHKISPQNVASKKVSLSNREKRLINQIVQVFADRSRKDITKWRDAIKQAEDQYFPKRYKLHQLYDDLELDTHYISQRELRILSVIGCPFKITKKSTGEEDPDKTRLFETPWFYNFKYQASLEIFRGTKVLEVDNIEEGELTGFKPIPGTNILPDFQEVTTNMYSNRGIPYNTPEQLPWVIEIKERYRFGLLCSLAPQLIWKKNAQQAWAEFGQRFGQPYRTATTNTRDMKQIARIETMLQEMGEAAYGLFPEGTTIDFKEFNTGDAWQVWDKQIERANTEISKAINGATMMSDVGANGSRAQSITHAETANIITEADKKNLAFIINWDLFPLLNMHGYDLQDYEFKWDNTEQLGISDHWKIVKEALEHFEVEEKWITQTFGIPIVGKKQASQANFNKAQPENRRPGGPVASRLTIPFPDYSTCSCCGGFKIHNQTDEIMAADPKLKNLFLNAAKTVFKKKSNKPDTLSEKEWNQLYKHVNKKFASGVEKGFGKKLAKIDYKTKDGQMLQKLRDNTFVFSAFKNFQLLQGLNELLLDENGNLREWEDFKAEAWKLHNLYNVNYLQVEYNNAVASSQMAAKWMRFLEDDDTLLRFQTVGDDRVREEHQVLDGLTKPKSDKIWDRYFPPLGWGCRCDVDEVLASTNKESNLDKFSFPDVPKLFRNNVGKTGVIFTEDHEYFKVSEGDKKELIRFAQDEIKKLKNAA